MSSKERPRFSVVIPAFNEAHYIADTLDSLQKQTFNGTVEIIVVDNNSSDKTAVIAKSLGAKVISEKNPGVCWARQAGTEAAQGEIVISTDADTKFDSDWLAVIDKWFKKYPDVVAVTGPCRYVGGPLWGEIYPVLLFDLVSIVYKITGKTYYSSATNIAFKKDVWDGYDTTMTQGGDELDLLRRLRKKGKVAFNNHNPTYTSSRRLARGFIYNFIITFLVYYILEYNLTRIFKRRVLGSAPKFRNELSPKIMSLLNSVIYLALLFCFLVYTGWGRHVSKWLYHTARNTSTEIREKGTEIREKI